MVNRKINCVLDWMLILFTALLIGTWQGGAINIEEVEAETAIGPGQLPAYGEKEISGQVRNLPEVRILKKQGRIAPLTGPAKQVKDRHTRKLMLEQGIDPNYVELSQDYARRLTAAEKAAKDANPLTKRLPEPSPYARTYRDRISGRYIMEVQGLPMVDADGVPVAPRWIKNGQVYQEKANLFHITVDKKGRTKLIVKNDQPDGRKKNQQLTFQPQLFLNGVEQKTPVPTLLAADPINPNYKNNTLEWEYGFVKRRMRLIEGHFLGSWVFPANPGGEVRIIYNQSGDYRLKLGRYAVSKDEEHVPASAFASATYPFTVSDSATFYPDASPEITSVDGYLSRTTGSEVWSTIRSGAGTSSFDSGTVLTINFASSTTINQWERMVRCIFLFDTSALPDTTTVTNAVLSLYGSLKLDDLGVSPTTNIYTSTPASNTALGAADYGQIGTIAQSTAISYVSWSTAGYNDFTLNDLTKIILTGVSKFGARNANYDVANIAPAWSNSLNSPIQAYASEKGAGYKPKLVVTYPSTFDALSLGGD